MTKVNGAGDVALTAVTRPWWQPTPRVYAALASAVLFGVAFPPFHLIVPSLICLVPLAIAIARDADGPGRAWQAARAGMVFGAVGYGINLYWIAIALSLYTSLAIAGYIASLVWLAPFVGLATAALFAARRLTRWPMAILLPVVWIALELTFNYLSDLSFPWLPLGLSMARAPALAQLADISGVRGVSFWIAAVNGFLADAWLLRANRQIMVRRLVAAAGIVAIAEAYGIWRINSIELTPLAKVAVIQPNIPQPVKMKAVDPTGHVGLLASLTRDVLAVDTPALVVWPETALNKFLWQYPHWADSLRSAVQGHPVPILTGMLDSNSPMDSVFRYYNAAMLTDPMGNPSDQPIYHKYFLVPIVERVPFLNPDWFRELRYFGGFGRGQQPVPFQLPFGGAGTLICYESIYPQLSRSYAKQGGVLLVNITNDAWFQRSIAPQQHFAHLIVRAIETRLPAVRSANTGISGYIDPRGIVREETDIFVPYTGTYTVESARMATLYVRFGDWLGMLCWMATLGLVIGAIYTRRRVRS